MLLSLLFVPTLHAAQPDPKGAFGFVWGDSPSTVQQKASAVKLSPVDGVAKQNGVFAYSGEIDGYKGLFRFVCRTNKLYTISVSMMDDKAFKRYDEIFADFTKRYGKPNEQKTLNGVTVTGWLIGDTTASVGMFSSKNAQNGQDEYITSVLYIQTSVERQVQQGTKKR